MSHQILSLSNLISPRHILSHLTTSHHISKHLIQSCVFICIKSTHISSPLTTSLHISSDILSNFPTSHQLSRLLTRSWNQTKNNSNLRHIATGYLRTYKFRNLNEAIATVRISRDKIYIYMYILTSLNELAHESHTSVFASARLRHGDFGLLRNEWKFVGLFLVSCFFWISSSKYRNWNSIQTQSKHFA